MWVMSKCTRKMSLEWYEDHILGIYVVLVCNLIGFANISIYFGVLDLLHIFSYLPRDLNFLEHTSNFGWKE